MQIIIIVIANYIKPLCSNEFSIKDTQTFPQLLRDSPPLKADEEYVSYDVDSLFTNIPLMETIEYIIKQIYTENKLPKICSKLIFKRLLIKITTECTFLFNNNFYKQIDGCSMGGPISVTLSDIFMIKMENDVVIPTKPIFYFRYVDDIINKRSKNKCDDLFIKLNSYHSKIKLTIEENPSKFLDTNIILKNNNVTTQVHRKIHKLPIPWQSKVPKRYKRNSILSDLYRSKRIASDFNLEVKHIKSKFFKANYPTRFTDSVIRDFNNKPASINDSIDMIIPPYLFEEKPPFILIEIPFCESNEACAKRFLVKLHDFTKHQFNFAIKWKTRKVKSLFKLKDQNIHPSCKIYKGECSCGEVYIGETKRNVEVRWAEHNNPLYTSEPALHLNKNITHSFVWSILCQAPSNTRIRKNLEASYIALLRPSLNDQLDFNKLNLFRNGVT